MPGHLIFKPALRRGRVPQDTALFLVHGIGLAEFEGHRYAAPYAVVDPARFGIGTALAEGMVALAAKRQRLHLRRGVHCKVRICRF